ncbi:hypothetical protein [Microvirga mediterraneensis]|uniref:Uncharacterized protein n=1 Tax=Microvirga mediterraneensis TaxID=2754695 RepID=A0A838BT76_9HYPH|nr:hypothetical protein [Microvirga mediterraneensis]MBA1158232.1 hypothetical protein [Microvirga mediterraneensis]
MTQQVSEQNIRTGEQNAARSIPAFKAVALPALAAAVQAAKPQQNPPKTSDLPAFLRKEAMLD